MSISRRSLLRSLVAASTLPLLRCRAHERTASRQAIPEGELVGAAVGHGHRLHRAPPVEAYASAPKRSTQVAIVGGGIAGLSAAWRLRAAGVQDVVVFEVEHALGGTARGGIVAGHACPWGAHYIASPRAEDRVLTRLLSDMGCVDVDAQGVPRAREEHLVHEPEERLYFQGRWTEGLYRAEGASAADARDMARFQAEIARWVSFRDGKGRRAFDLPLARSSDDEAPRALDAMTATQWLDQLGVRSTRLRWWVDYACRDDFGMRASQASAWAAVHYFASRVGGAGDAPAPLITWPSGNGAIVEHLAQPLGPRRQTGWLICDVAPHGDNAANEGAHLLAMDAQERLVAWSARHVVMAVPQFVNARIVRPWREGNPPGHTRAFRYSAWVVVNLAVERPPRGKGFDLAWDNVLYDSDSLGYVVASHQQGLGLGPTVLTWYRPLLDDDPAQARRSLYDHDREHWVREALSDLGRAHPQLRDSCTRADVMRWGHAMVRPEPGLFFGGARQAAAQPLGALHFAHTELSGMALCEEALDHGVRAAEEILARMGTLDASWRSI